MNYTALYNSPLGEITLASDGTSLTGLWFEGQKYFAATLAEDATENEDLPVFNTLTSWLDRYFSGENPDASELPLAPAGSDFRQSVWQIMRKIPYGTLTTYAAIAACLSRQTGKPKMSAHAVGGAVAHNPVSIIIPCHRVVGFDGSLTGYAGGIDKKIKLLELEGADMSGLYVPKKGTAL